MAIVLAGLGAAVGCGSRTPLPVPGEIASDAGDDASPVGPDGGTLDGTTPRDASPVCTPHGGSCTMEGQCCNGEACSDSTCGGSGACNPDGTMCTSFTPCCSGSCFHGFCGPPSNCQGQGAICSIGSQCCSRQCTDNLCGAGNCAALGPSPCDTCTALSCCGALSACEPDPGCLSYLQCVVGCESDGGTGFSCTQGQCASLGGSLAGQLEQCVQQMCLTECTSG